MRTRWSGTVTHETELTKLRRRLRLSFSSLAFIMGENKINGVISLSSKLINSIYSRGGEGTPIYELYRVCATVKGKVLRQFSLRQGRNQAVSVQNISGIIQSKMGFFIHLQITENDNKLGSDKLRSDYVRYWFGYRMLDYDNDNVSTWKMLIWDRLGVLMSSLEQGRKST